MNPFDPYAPASFVLFVGLLAAVLASMRVGHALLARPRRLHAPSALDAYEAALLAGDAPRVTETALAALVLNGHVVVREGRRALAARVPPPPDAPPEAQAVFAAFTTLESDHWFGELIVPAATVQTAKAVAAVETRLNRAGLRPTAEERSEFARAAVYGGLALGFAGFLLTAFQARQGEVPWPMVAVAAVYLLTGAFAINYVPRLSRAGRATLEAAADEREAALRLPGEGGEASPAAWTRAVAWGGLAAVEAGPLAPLARTLAAPAEPGAIDPADDDGGLFREGDLVPEEAAPWGYVAADVARPSTREELERLASEAHTPRLVWTPDVRVLRHPAEVPQLFARMKARVEAQAAAPVKSAAWHTGMYLLLWAGSSEFRVPSFWLIMAVAELFSLWTADRERRSVLPVTPEGLRAPPAPVELSPWLLRVRTRTAVHTPWLLGGVTVVFLAQLLPGDAVAAAGLDKGAVRAGEWWRLLTGAVLHGHVLHLLMNVVGLEVLGGMVERFSRRAHLPLVVLLSALGGSLASLAASDVTSVGISGGVLGCLGFLLGLGWRWRRHVAPGFFRAMVAIAGINAVVGAAGYGMIDNAAHAGGLAVGLALAFLLLPGAPPEEDDGEPPRGTVAGWVGAGAFLAVCALAVTLILAGWARG